MPGHKASKNSPVAPAPAARPTDPRLAVEAIRPEADALHPDDVMSIRVDIPRAVSTALGAFLKIGSHRDEIAEQMPAHPMGLLDKLETYAVAALYAHLTLVASEDALKALLAEATTLREDLLVGAEALAHRGKLDRKRVADVRSGQGQLDLANDLVALGVLFSAAWEDVKASTAVTRTEVDRASVLGLELLTALGARDQGPAPISESKDARARFFTLFARAYDSCRRALVYLRWAEGDADEIAPSLFRVGRRAGKKNQVVEEDTSTLKSETAKVDLAKTEAAKTEAAKTPTLPEAEATPDKAPVANGAPA